MPALLQLGSCSWKRWGRVEKPCLPSMAVRRLCCSWHKPGNSWHTWANPMGSLNRKDPNLWDLHLSQAGGSGAARAALWSQRDGAEGCWGTAHPLTLSSHLYSCRLAPVVEAAHGGHLPPCGGHPWNPTWCSLLRRSPRKWCRSPPEAQVPCVPPGAASSTRAELPVRRQGRGEGTNHTCIY